MVDPATITAAITAAASAIGLIDKIADQIKRYLTKIPEAKVPREYRLKIQGKNDTLVAQYDGKVLQTITAKDLEKLPESQLRHVQTYEKSMKNHYKIWSAVYPQLATMDSPVSKARVEAQLDEVIEGMKKDLNGILSFLESSGLQLDDHYIEIRQLVNQA